MLFVVCALYQVIIIKRNHEIIKSQHFPPFGIAEERGYLEASCVSGAFLILFIH